MPNALTPARRRGWLVAAAVAATLALSGCENKSETAAAPLAAKVNDDVITVPQIEHVVQQQRGLKPEQAEAASRVVLQRLVERATTKSTRRCSRSAASTACRSSRSKRGPNRLLH